MAVSTYAIKRELEELIGNKKGELSGEKRIPPAIRQRMKRGLI